MTKVAVTVARCFFEAGAGAVYPAMVRLESATNGASDDALAGLLVDAPAGEGAIPTKRQIEPTDAAIVPTR